MKKKLLLSSFIIVCVFSIFVLLKKEVKKNDSNTTQKKISTKGDLSRSSKLRKSKKIERKLRNRSTGSYRGKRKLNNNEFSEFKFNENSFLKKNNLLQVKGLFASHQKIANKEIFKRYNGHYIYENSDGYLENIFMREGSNRLMIWSGEVVIEGSDLILDELKKMTSVQVVKQIGGAVILKVLNTEDYWSEIDELENSPLINELQLDLRAQRRHQI